MSLHASVISIEGDHLEDAKDIFERANYRVLGAPEIVTSNDEIEKHLSGWMINKTQVKKVAYYAGGWTDILDSEMVLFNESDVWIELSALWKTRILCWICEGTSGTYAFSLYENGKRIRSVLSTDGEINEEFGEQILEEEGVDWTAAFEDDVLKIADQLGAPYGYLEQDQKYHVYVLDESHM